MDSLTQIILGAAIGEVALGRKMGNRAMLWGAVGGTIPDLDVLANFVTDEITALAFHRAFMHSLFFAATLPFVVGWLVHRLYASGRYLEQSYRAWGYGFWMVLYTLAAVGFSFLPVMAGGSFSPLILGVMTLGGGVLGRHLWYHYYLKTPRIVNTTYWDWVGLFFWTIITHPLLDCCTTFGTQIFQPFSDYRVAFNIVSVVDPIYSVPFLLCLIVASWYLREHRLRRWFSWAGIVFSCGYLLFTYYHKTQVNHAFEETLAEKNIAYDRYMTGPTIFNNILWNCVAESKDEFYMGTYSLYDQKPYFQVLQTLPKHREWLAPYEGQRTTRILQWFSNDYYILTRNKAGQLVLNDLRFGSIGENALEADDFVFKFILTDKDGQLHATQDRGRGVNAGEENPFGALWERMKGR